MSRPRLDEVLWGNATSIWTWLGAVVLVHGVHYGLGLGQPSLGLALSSAALPALVVSATPPRARRWSMFVVILLLTVLAVANAAYYRFFQHYIPLESFSAAGNGVKHRSYLSGLLRITDMLPIAAVLATTVTMVAATRAARAGPPLAGRWIVTLPIVVSLLGSAPALRWAWSVSPVDHDNGSGGFLYSALADFRRLIGEWMIPAEPSQAEWDRIVASRSAREAIPPPDDEWFGRAAGSSVIIIKVEGLNGWMIDADVQGQPVMPTLRALAGRGLTFTELFDATGEGRSSDADYLVMASQQRLEHAAVALARPNLHPTTLATVLGARGYATFSADAGSPTSWNAARRHAQFGFRQSRFGPDLGTERMGMGMPDRLFFERITPLVEQLPSPFLVWLHTVTMHGPHRIIPDSLHTLPLGPLEDTPLGNYLDKAHYTDDVIRGFVAALDAAGTLAKTTLVIYGDHTEQFEFDRSAMRGLARVTTLAETEAALDLDKVPVIVVPPGSTTGVRVSTVGGLIDLTPTLLHLLGLAPAPSFMGRSLMPASPGFAASASGRAIATDRVWNGNDCYNRPDGTKRAAADCDALRDKARDQLNISWLITRYDLSRRLDSAALARRDPSHARD